MTDVRNAYDHFVFFLPFFFGHPSFFFLSRDVSKGAEVDGGHTEPGGWSQRQSVANGPDACFEFEPSVQVQPIVFLLVDLQRNQLQYIKNLQH